MLNPGSPPPNPPRGFCSRSSRAPHVSAELLSDLLKKRPKETDGIESVIVVDNVPCVGADRLEKLQNVIRKIFSKFGKIQTEHYPMTEEKKTKG